MSRNHETGHLGELLFLSEIHLKFELATSVVSVYRRCKISLKGTAVCEQVLKCWHCVVMGWNLALVLACAMAGSRATDLAIQKFKCRRGTVFAMCPWSSSLHGLGQDAHATSDAHSRTTLRSLDISHMLRNPGHGPTTAALPGLPVSSTCRPRLRASPGGPASLAVCLDTKRSCQGTSCLGALPQCLACAHF